MSAPSAPRRRRTPARRTLRIPADLASLAPVRDLLAEDLERRGWSREDVWRVVLVVQEALVNAVTHGSAAGGHVEVRFAVHRERARVRLRDGGRAGGPSPSGPVVAPPASQPTGRGRLIMEALADAVDSRQAGSGTRVSLAFVRRPASHSTSGRPDRRPSRSAGSTMLLSGPRR